MRLTILIQALRVLAVLLILQTLFAIFSNYPDYFPPNFESLFLLGREKTFSGIYPLAFYIHIFTGPLVLLNGLFLLSDTLRSRYRATHRFLGWVQVLVLLILFLPSSLIMACFAFAGFWSGLSFFLLTLTTAISTTLGVHYARRRSFGLHRRWMQRSYVLICSAITLRLISGTLSLYEISNAEIAYIIASWCSWLVPLLLYETFARVHLR
ncbi:DUF2306 domain-containing protein [Telmatocola sphagniphila]|uniref:DUF2306 domain-containing protein n=1 Tax=Telmatocola sphagniphila TaxID=1123043 RepID=UPI001FE420A6|nr:DUF2306 domain-containing protein [Telmatocola sphagniphila]